MGRIALTKKDWLLALVIIAGAAALISALSM